VASARRLRDAPGYPRSRNALRDHRRRRRGEEHSLAPHIFQWNRDEVGDDLPRIIEVAADVGAEQFVVGGDVFACDWVARHVEIIRAGREILSLRGAKFSHLEGFFP